MAELQQVKQETKSNELPTEPAFQEQPEIVGKCPWPLSKGINKGEPCNAPTFDGEKYCTSHVISATRRAVKEGKSKEEVAKINIRDEDLTEDETKHEPLPPQTEANTITIPIIVTEQPPSPNIPIVVKAPQTHPKVQEATPLPERVLLAAPSNQGICNNSQQFVQKYLDLSSQKHTQDEVLIIMKNFSIAMVGLIEILKK